MQCNKSYVTKEAPLQVNETMEKIYYNQVLPQNCSAFPDCPVSWNPLGETEIVEDFQQETKQTINNLYSNGHRSSGMSLTKRRKLNRERERKRQARLKGAFNVLRSIIPDYFSGTEPGDRLSRIQTLRLAKKYIATLHELLETS